MPLDPATASLIVGGANALGGALGSIGAGKRQRDQNKANMKLAEYSYNKDLEMWNTANAYNTPEAQMQRIEKAGLNKNMVYGTGSVTGNSTGTLPKFQAPQRTQPTGLIEGIGNNIPQVISTFQDFSMKQLQMDNLKSQTERTQIENANADIERNLMLTQLAKAGVSKKLLDQQYGFNAQNNPIALDLARTQASIRQQDFRKKGLELAEWIEDKPHRRTMQGYKERSGKYGSLMTKYNYEQRGKIKGSPLLEFIQKALTSAGVDPIGYTGDLLKKLIAHNNSNGWKFDPFGWNDPKPKPRGAGGSWGTWRDGIPNN